MLNHRKNISADRSQAIVQWLFGLRVHNLWFSMFLLFLLVPKGGGEGARFFNMALHEDSWVSCICIPSVTPSNL